MLRWLGLRSVCAVCRWVRHFPGGGLGLYCWLGVFGDFLRVVSLGAVVLIWCLWGVALAL